MRLRPTGRKWNGWQVSCSDWGNGYLCYHPNEVMPLGHMILCVAIDGNPQKIDIVYRFWELFDLDSITSLDHILDVLERGRGECDSSDACLSGGKTQHLGCCTIRCLHAISGRSTLSKSQFKLAYAKSYRRPGSWILRRFHHVLCLDAPHVGRVDIRSTAGNSWAKLRKRERDLILKISGFDETAWGARSVVLWDQMSPGKSGWRRSKHAVEGPHQSLYVLQQYRKPIRVKHPVYRDDGSLHEMDGRVRLCPYYFIVNGRAELHGILATLCPSDKKIIHGMKDAALIPCCESRAGD